jgi:hypothetical protein
MLPDLFQIEISDTKITGYLLNLQHPDGWGKAKFFRQHGFTTTDAVKALLLFIIQQHEVKETIQTDFGVKYIVEGAAFACSPILLRTVWIVLKGENSCKFVTAYPI